MMGVEYVRKYETVFTSFHMQLSTFFSRTAREIPAAQRLCVGRRTSQSSLVVEHMEKVAFPVDFE